MKSTTGSQATLRKYIPRPGEDMWIIWEQKIRSEFPRAQLITSTALEKLLYPPEPVIIEEEEETTAEEDGEEEEEREVAKPPALPSVILLDVRNADEYKISKLHPRAVRIGSKPKAEMVKKLVHQLSKDISGEFIVVCYGSIGYRSSKITQHLIDQGVLKGVEIFNLKGGIFNWANERKPLFAEDMNGNPYPVEAVHPQNPVFGVMLNADLHRYPEPKRGCVIL